MFAKLQKKLSGTRSVFRKIGSLFLSGKEREAVLEDLAEALIMADVGAPTTEKIIGSIRTGTAKDAGPDELLTALKKELKLILTGAVPTSPPAAGNAHFVFLMVGANGGGKTTSAAKLAARASKAGKTVILAAADTFRAAAKEQLVIWSQRLGTQVITGQYGADPASVVFDAAASFKARTADLLIVDTAGRSHTNLNLMNELEKVNRILKRELPEAGRESLLVLDSSIGQNAIVQAREFLKFSALTGTFLTKIDGTAKGGVAVAIAGELGLPIKYLGIGEQPEDLVDFSAEEFVEALLT